MPRKKWWSEGIKFKCQGSGKCCVSRGTYGYVYLTQKDRKRMAKFFHQNISNFTKNFCQKSSGYFHLKNDKKKKACIFLEDKKCTVYSARPEQCRTWPFWPEHMSPKQWNLHVASFCPGIGKGKVYSGKKIESILKKGKI